MWNVGYFKWKTYINSVTDLTWLKLTWVWAEAESESEVDSIEIDSTRLKINLTFNLSWLLSRVMATLVLQQLIGCAFSPTLSLSVTFTHLCLIHLIHHTCQKPLSKEVKLAHLCGYHLHSAASSSFLSFSPPPFCALTPFTDQLDLLPSTSSSASLISSYLVLDPVSWSDCLQTKYCTLLTTGVRELNLPGLIPSCMLSCSGIYSTTVGID